MHRAHQIGKEEKMHAYFPQCFHVSTTCLATSVVLDSSESDSEGTSISYSPTNATLGNFEIPPRKLARSPLPEMVSTSTPSQDNRPALASNSKLFMFLWQFYCSTLLMLQKTC